MQRLKDQVAIVTGGAGGIGRVFSHGLAAEAAHVVIADLAEDAAQQLAAELTEAGHECHALCVDVGDASSTEAMASQVLDHFGRIDILVNCAALYATLARRVRRAGSLRISR